MGLDIYAYSRIIEKSNRSANQRRLEELGLSEPGEEIYRIETPDEEAFKGLDPGTYLTTSLTEYHSFRAGSYSGYNNWRRALCLRMLGIEPEELWNDTGSWKDSPFFSLINHSDCDGAIGGPVAKSLFLDFVKHRHRAEGLSEIGNEDGGWFLEVYDDFLRGFELAADDGILIFS